MRAEGDYDGLWHVTLLLLGRDIRSHPDKVQLSDHRHAILTHYFKDSLKFIDSCVAAGVFRA